MFEMGTGVSLLPSSPYFLFYTTAFLSSRNGMKEREESIFSSPSFPPRKHISGQAFESLVSVSSKYCYSYTPDLSNGSSLRALSFLSEKRKSRLEEGFVLRCLQRLSFPDLATEPCSWRNNSYTRGLSIPVLSY